MKKHKIEYLITAGLIVIIIIAACGRRNFPLKTAEKKYRPFDTAAFDYVFVEALRNKLMGNGGEALKLFEQASKMNPGSDAVWFQMAQILNASGNRADVKKYALKAYDIDSSNFWYMMMLAGTYYAEKNIDSAIVFYEKAVNKFPEREELKITLANLYSEGSKYESAAAIFEELDKRYGVNKASTLGSVKNLMWSGKWDEALLKAQSLLEQDPDEILFNGLLAEIYRGMGQPEKAADVYGKLIERNPENPQIQLAICDFLIEETKYDDLMGMLNTVILNEKISKQEKISLMAVIIEKQDLVEDYNKQIELALMVLEAAYPEDQVITLLRPELLIASGRLDQAAEKLEAVLKKYPDSYYAAEKLMLLYYQEGRFDVLEKRGEQLSRTFNRSFLAKMLYAAAASENGRFEIALEELRKADILAGNDEELKTQVLTQRADVFYRMKDFGKAFATFEEALAGQKKDITVLNNYAYFLAEQNLKLKYAEEMAEKVIEEEGDNHTYLDTYAWVLYKRGKAREAERIMKRILEEGGSDAEYYEHLGFIMRKRKNCNEAVKYWEEAMKMDKTKDYLLNEIEQCVK
ncbi:MAG TPA: tetratricopeptide repeat protein [Bacteroidales bacterium]|nr:tetratricopeptide repeat protein [Bacteroidales bacterium]HPI68555.1 tetratricopeptide repeat protein [Bacteroidales bacterium]HPR72502.1 tetratricopeptide repeat protein [Bacteroidales bacterium]HRW85787.1 tetratricopeptide repeat protein [Bacteroidales bacterium]